MITFEDKKLYEFISKKEVLIDEGIKVSDELEKIEAKIKRLEGKEKFITGKVKPPKELEEKGDALAKELDLKTKELFKIADQIEAIKLAAVPPEIKKEHEELMTQREVKERERNKIALKVQKIKDRIVPHVQRIVKPLLKEEFDDVGSAKIKDGKIVVETFNWLEDWKRSFRRK